MSAYAPSLFDRLVNEEVVGRDGVRFRQSAEQVKAAVARDIEALLNASPSYDEQELADLPLVGTSIVGFGLVDITSLSMASEADRQRLVRSVEKCLADHEPRLRGVTVTVHPHSETGDRLVLSIRGQLVLKPNSEPVAFDAVMLPGSTRYVVSRSNDRTSAGVQSAPVPSEDKGS